MNTILLINNHSIQGTYEIKKSQIKECSFFKKEKINNSYHELEDVFVEERLKSNRHILNKLYDVKCVYFYLSTFSDEKSIFNFLDNFLALCYQAKIKLIVFDSSKYISDQNCPKKKNTISQIERRLIKSSFAVTVVKLKSNKVFLRNNNNAQSDIIDIDSIAKINKYLKAIYVIKESVFQENMIGVETTESKKEMKYEYYLN